MYSFSTFVLLLLCLIVTVMPEVSSSLQGLTEIHYLCTLAYELQVKLFVHYGPYAFQSLCSDI